jgi:hypothetical protein
VRGSFMKKIIKIATNSGFYFLDIATNEIIRISESLYNSLDEFGDCISNESNVCLVVDELRKRGFLRELCDVSCRVNHLFYRNQKISLENFIKEYCRQLVLEITDACNLRCSVQRRDF